MSEQKKGFSKLCLAGFILTILPLGVLLLSLICSNAPRDIRFFITEKLLPFVFVVLPLMGLIVSIAGLVTVRKNGKKGKGFGIAGVALPVIAIIGALVIIVPILVSSAVSGAAQRNNDMYAMGGVGSRGYWNIDYDVSGLKLPEGYEFSNITVSDAEFKEYAESRLKEITDDSDRSIRGIYEDYNFLIVRTDMLDAWLASNSPSGFGYNQGYATISYEMTWEIAATKEVPLAVYKDPSDKFIVITNCGDYKIISEFFGVTDNHIEPDETEITTVETMSSEYYENYDQVVFLRNNINEEMTLPEIISVFEQNIEEHPGNDVLWFKAGQFYNGYYDPSAGEYVLDGDYYCFGLERWISNDEGVFQVDVYVLYERNTTNKSIKGINESENSISGDFFDFVRDSKAYEYASTADIVRIDIYMAPL